MSPPCEAPFCPVSPSLRSAALPLPLLLPLRLRLPSVPLHRLSRCVTNDASARDSLAQSLGGVTVARTLQLLRVAESGVQKGEV